MQLTQKAKAIIIGLTIPLAIAGGATGMLVADYQNVADRAAVLEAQVQEQEPKPMTKTTKAKPAKATPTIVVTKYVPVRATQSAAHKPQTIATKYEARPKPTKSKTTQAKPDVKVTPKEQETPVSQPSPEVKTPNPEAHKFPDQYKPKTGE